MYSFSISDKALSLYKDFYTKIVCNYATFEKKILSQSIFGVLHKNTCLVLYNFTIKAKHPTTQVMGRFFTQILLCHIQAAVHVEGNSHRRLHVVGGVVEDGGVGNALFGAIDDEIILLAIKVVVAGDDVVFVVGRNAPVKSVGGLAVRVDVERCAGMLGRDALGVHVDALAVYRYDRHRLFWRPPWQANHRSFARQAGWQFA